MMRTAGTRMLAEAQALRAAFPDAVAMRAVTIGAAPAADDYPALASAMKYLRDEMVLVQDGTAHTLGVMDDEMAHVEDLLARL